MLPSSASAARVDSLVAPLLSLLTDTSCSGPVLLGGACGDESLAIQVIPLDADDPLVDLETMAAPDGWDLALVRLPHPEHPSSAAPVVAGITRRGAAVHAAGQAPEPPVDAASADRLRGALLALFDPTRPRRSTGPTRS